VLYTSRGGLGVMKDRLNRSVKARWVTWAMALPVLFVTAEAALGQEVGEAQIFFVTGSSDTPAFASYSGFGVAVAFVTRGVFRLRAAFDTEGTSLMREGWVCNEVGKSCQMETGILDETRRENVSMTLQAVLALSERVSLSAAAGPHFSNLRWESTSASQRSGEGPPPTCQSGVCTENGVPSIEFQRRIRLGAVLSGEVRIRPMPNGPFFISAGWDRKAVNMTGCAPIDARRYAPFCGWAHSDEPRFGLGVVF